MSDATDSHSAVNNEGQEWELSKENAAPLERGRNVKTLMRALSSAKETDEEKRINEKTIRQHERLVRPSERRAEQLAAQRKAGGNGEEGEDIEEDESEENDPLVHWLSYIKFHQDTYPSDTQQEFLLMERCTRSLLHVRKYANDVRFIRVCILYADKTSCAGDIYKFLNKQKVGTKAALFWTAWSWVAEKAGDFAFAEKILAKGFSKGAKPQKLLENRQKQFRRRMSRHWLNLSKQQDEDGIALEEADERENQARGVRNALGGLSSEGTRVNHRSRAANNNRDTLSTFSSRGTRSSSQNDNNGVKPKGGFNIFVDENDENNDNCLEDEDYDHRHRMLTKEKDRRKENTMKAERWNERGGLAHSSHIHEDTRSVRLGSGALDAPPISFRNRGASAPSPAPHSEPAPTFEIFVDGECAEKNEAEKDERERKERGHGVDGRSLRQRMDGSVADKLARDPLRYVRNPSKFVSDNQREKNDRANPTKKHRSNSEKTGRSDRDENQNPQTSKMQLKEKEKKIHQTTNESRPESSKTACGFSKRLLAKDAMGQECCFEEGRASAQSYNLFCQNFNLLEDVHHALKQRGEQPGDDSAMDVEEIDEVEMEDDFPIFNEQINTVKCNTHMKGEQLNSSFVQTAGQDSCSKAPMPRRALFDTSICDTIQQNISTTSSTINEQDAVGAPAEETINTKFARLEMSVMFSSPDKEEKDELHGVVEADVGNTSAESVKPLFSLHGGVQSNSATEGRSVKKNNGDSDRDDGTVTFSMVDELVDDGINTRKQTMPSEVMKENEENIAPRNPLGRKNRTPGLGGCALRAIAQTELDDNIAVPVQQNSAIGQNRTVRGQKNAHAAFGTSPVQEGVGSGFQIYCDEYEENYTCSKDEEGKSQQIMEPSQNILQCAPDPPGGEDGGAAFAIFCDDEADDSLQNEVQHAPDSPNRNDAGAPFTIFCDDEGNGYADEEKSKSDGGDTATLSLFGEVLKGMECEERGSKKSKRKVASQRGRGNFSVYSDNNGPEKEKSILRSKPVQVKPRNAGFSIFCDDDTHDDMVR